MYKVLITFRGVPKRLCILERKKEMEIFRANMIQQWQEKTASRKKPWAGPHSLKDRKEIQKRKRIRDREAETDHSKKDIQTQVFFLMKWNVKYKIFDLPSNSHFCALPRADLSGASQQDVLWVSSPSWTHGAHRSPHGHLTGPPLCGSHLHAFFSFLKGAIPRPGTHPCPTLNLCPCWIH